MSTPSGPIITRPVRSPLFATNSGGAQVINGSKSPSAFFQAFTKNPASPSINSLTPRAPIVHFFVCDHGNAKVKAFSDQFIELLIQNGIKVFPEYYLTHQPGYQVRAASFDTNADFFFQIHSKTAGPGHVRIYIEGQPQRMSVNEAVPYVWSNWRLRCGALSKPEVDSLSMEKINFLINKFGKMNPDSVNVSPVQNELRRSIRSKSPILPILDHLLEMAAILEEGRKNIAEVKTINSEWEHESGQLLQRCLPTPEIVGLSPPLRTVLQSMIEQAQQKVSALIDIAQIHAENEEPPADDTLHEEEEGGEVQITEDPSASQTSWSLMLESIEDSRHSMSSFGRSIGSQGFLSMANDFLLDDF